MQPAHWMALSSSVGHSLPSAGSITVCERCMKTIIRDDYQDQLLFHWTASVVAIDYVVHALLPLHPGPGYMS